MKGKFLSLLVCCLIWGSSGKPTNVFFSYQDSLGQYSFGYSALSSARSEVKTLNGGTRGAYSYVDENGVIQSTEYIADDEGFRVISTNLPQAPLPVEDTPEVAIARKEHLEAHKLAQQMAEAAGNDQERIVLSKVNVDQNEGLENKNLEGSTIMDEVERTSEVSNMDNQVLNSKEGETRPREESILKDSTISVLKDRLGLNNVPVYEIIHGNQQSEKNLAIQQGPNVAV